MKPFKSYTFKLFNIGKPVARAIMKAHKKRGISRTAWLLEAVSYKLVREGITLNTDNYGPVHSFLQQEKLKRLEKIKNLDIKTSAERAFVYYKEMGFTYAIFFAQTGNVKLEVMSNPDIVKSTFEDGSSCFTDYSNHSIKLNVKAELKEVSN